MDLHFTIENQRLTRNEKRFIVDKSNNYLELVFDFKTDDWNETTKFAILKNNTEAYLLEIIENKVTVPYDAIKDNQFRITVYGLKTDETRITTNEIGLLLNYSGYTRDLSNITDLTPSVAEDLYLKLEGKSEVDHTHSTDDVDGLADVATTGDYNDLINKPVAENVYWSDVLDKPSSFPPSVHSHSKSDVTDFPSIPSRTSDLTNDGDGVNVFVKNNDSRLSDARTPVSHSHTVSEITDFPTSIINAKADKSYVDGLIGDINDYINR